jgi:heat shock protein HtpX
LAISRRREFMADAGAISITRQPQGLISALSKISKDREPLEVANKATAHFYIINPFKGKAHGALNWFSKLFNTHPPVNERIKILKQMA